MAELRYDEVLAGEVEPVSMGEYRFGLLADEWPHGYSKMLPSTPIPLGPYHVGGADSFPEVLSKVLADIYMAAGKHPEDEFRFALSP